MLKIFKYTNGAVVVKNLGYARTYNIDGKIYKGIDEIILSEIPTKIQEVQNQSVILDYKYHKDDNAIILEKDYQTALQSLTDRCDEDGNFDNLDNEFAYRKFIESWIPNNTKNIEEIIDVEFNVFVLQEIEEKYKSHIYSVAHHHNWDGSEYYCGVIINIKLIVSQLAEKYGFKEVDKYSSDSLNTFSHPDNTGRFLKINGNYHDHQVVLQLRYLTYDQAKEHVDKISNIFEESFKIERALLNQDECDAATISNILQNLIDIQKHFDKVIPSQKTKLHYSKVGSQLKDLINILIDQN